MMQTYDDSLSFFACFLNNKNTVSVWFIAIKIWEIAEVSCKYRIGCFSWKKVDIQKGVKTWVVAKELKAFHEKEIFTFNSTDTLKFYFQLTLDQVIEQN